jgi:hypothetical protein
VTDRPTDEFEQVRLILARQRSLGMSFEDAWPLALATVPVVEGRDRHAQQR